MTILSNVYTALRDFVILFLLWWLYHQGQLGVEAKDAKAAASQNAAVAVQEAKAADNSAKAVQNYETALKAPVTDAPVYELQPITVASRPRKVLSGAAPASGVQQTPALREADSGVPAKPVYWSSKPIVQAGRDADVTQEALVDWINANCYPPK